MEEKKIQDGLFARKLGRPCICLEQVDSTNAHLQRLALEGAVPGTLLLAEQQREGRGRRGRDWVSSPGETISMSLLLQPEMEAERASSLTLVMGLAAAKACNEILKRQLGEKTSKVLLKWPNDLIMNGKKIGGILAELHFGTEGTWNVILGIGINVNTVKFPEALVHAGSLLGEASRFGEKNGLQPFSREELVILCMQYFEEAYESFLLTKDLRALRGEYESLLANKDQEVRVLDPAGEYQGIARGINDVGELLVEFEKGEFRAVYAGEVSVRGIYGYI